MSSKIKCVFCDIIEKNDPSKILYEVSKPSMGSLWDCIAPVIFYVYFEVDH